MARLKARKAKIVLLYCDNLASLDCVRGQFYRDALALSDHVIVPCKAMSVRARNFLPSLTPVTVIEIPGRYVLRNLGSLSQNAPCVLVGSATLITLTFFAKIYLAL